MLQVHISLLFLGKTDIDDCSIEMGSSQATTSGSAAASGSASSTAVASSGLPVFVSGGERNTVGGLIVATAAALIALAAF